MLKLELSSGDGEECAGCCLFIVFWKWYITIPLPQIIKPHREQHKAVYWDAGTIERMGRDWYWEYTERRYGFYLYENHFNIMYGLSDCLGNKKDQRWSCFLPWNEWRFVRFSLYDLQGKEVFTNWETTSKEVRRCQRECQEQAEKDVPKRTFTFKDYDGEEIEATTHIEEREWWRGEKYFKWLSWFYAPKISRSLDIAFSKEVGPKKGSWKGGTIGHGIDLLPSELHESAFKRYCEKYNLILLTP